MSLCPQLPLQDISTGESPMIFTRGFGGSEETGKVRTVHSGAEWKKTSTSESSIRKLLHEKVMVTPETLFYKSI